MRYVCLATLLALSALAPSAAFGQLGSLSIPSTTDSYPFVSEQRITRTTSNVTYRAILTNTGTPWASVTATLTSLDPTHIQVVPGQGVLNFAPVPANSKVTSSNTFTILVDRSVNFDVTKLQWTFQAVSQKPVANAGPNQMVAVNTTVTLNGSGSTNPSGIGTLTYSWSFTSKPNGSNAVLLNPTSVMPTFVADAVGTWVIALTVSNGTASDTASVSVSTNTPPAPVANAGPNQTVTQGATVVLNGGASTSGSGNPLTYAWTLAAPTGSTAVLTGANTVSPSFVADKPNATYTATLIVNDGFASSAPSTVTIKTGVVAPVANAGTAQVVNVNSVVQLNGAGSTDANGLPLTYQWSLITLPPGSAAALSSTTAVNPTFTPDRTGTYVAQLIVNNGQLSSTASTVTITTNTPLAPTANAGTAQTVNVGSSVTLSGSGTDPQNLPLTFKWSLINKPANSSAVLSSTVVANPTFTADLAGSYVAQLIVNNGLLDSAPATVTISTTCSQPTANAGPNQNVLAGSTVTLDGTKSGDACNDPLIYSWTLTTVPQGSTATLTGATTSKPTFVADLVGTYVAQLIVDNGFSKSNPVTVTILAGSRPTITLTPNPLPIFTGSTAQLTVTLSNTAGGTINLASSNTAIATVPATVTVPSGSSSATVTVTGVAVGSTTITGSATGFTSGTTAVNVANVPTITVGSTSVNLGQTANLSITLSAPAPVGGVTINLVSSDTSKVVTPASVFIGEGLTTPASAPQVTGAGIGSATITASASGYTSGTGTITVPAPTLSFTGSPLAITLPGTGTLTLNLANGTAPTGGLTVNLVSNDTSKATVPATVTIAAGATSATVTVTAIAQGTATITASATGINSATATVNVAPPPAITVAPLSVNLGQTGNLQITLATAAPAGGLTVNLSSGDTGKVTVPATVSVAAGATTATATATAVGIGSATITASATGYTTGTGTVTVTPPTASLGGATTVQTGSTATLTLTLTNGQAPAAGLTFNLASSDTSKATVPATVNVAAGGTTAPVTVTGVGTGPVIITASATGITPATANLTVTSPPKITVGALTVNLGQSDNIQITLSAAAPAGGLTVNLSSSDTTKVTVPATISIAGGTTSGTATATAVGIGSATITASATGYTSGTGTVTVPAPTIAFSGSPLSVKLGGTGTLTLNLSGGQAPAGGLTFNLVSSNPAVATVPATVVFSGGAASAPVTVTGVATGGPITITASATGITSATASVTVTNPLTIVVPASTTLPLGQAMPFTVTLSAVAPAGGLTVNLASSDTSKVTVSPTSIVIAAGSTTPATQPTVTGAGVGSATITASANGATSGSGTVTVGAPLVSFPDSPITISVGGQGSLTLSLTGGLAPANGLTFSLSSSDTSKVTVPATVTIPAGKATSLVFPVTGIAPTTSGTPVTITASSPGITPATASVTVQPVGPSVLPLSVPSVSVGQNLQTSITVSLLMTDPVTKLPVPAAAPTGGLTVSVTSSDPTKLLIASSASCPSLASPCGAQQVKFTIPEGLSTASGIYLQSLASSGTVTLTASALGFPTGQGTVTLTPSGFQLSGPLGVSTINTSAGAAATTLTVTAVQLNSSLQPVTVQQIRGGYNDPINGPFDDAQGSQTGFPFANLSGLFKPVVPVSSSSPSVGTATSATLNGGDSTGFSSFKPLAQGTTTLTAVAPPGFSTPASGTMVVANVSAPTVSCGPVTVGQNLEATTTCNLLGGTPSAGQSVTITSSDPSKFTLGAIAKGSSTCTDAGTSSITVTTVNASQGGTNIVIPTFCVYGVANSGTATFSVNLTGYAPATGTVNLAPSGFVIAGPGGIGKTSFTPFTTTTTLSVSSALLDASNNFVAVQPLAIGQSASVNLSSSNVIVGTVSPSTLPFTGGMSSNSTTFTAATGGSTTLSVNTPAGFTTPANDTTVTANVQTPGFALSCDSTQGTIIGLNLETSCTIGVANAVVADTVVTVTSNQPAKLLLSNTATGAGVTTITVTIPAGTNNASFFAQSLASSGTATYSVSAPLFQPATKSVNLVPSGVTIAGPFGVGTSFFFSNVNVPVDLTVMTSALLTDPASCPQVAPPATGVPCYGQTQALRGGLPSVQVTVTTTLGTVTSPVTITAGSSSATSTFTSGSQGTATVNVVTPAGFTTSTNDTALTTNVNP